MRAWGVLTTTTTITTTTTTAATATTTNITTTTTTATTTHRDDGAARCRIDHPPPRVAEEGDALEEAKHAKHPDHWVQYDVTESLGHIRHSLVACDSQPAPRVDFRNDQYGDDDD